MAETIYVAVDVETTGFDPVRDAIIDVAAITFQGDAILEEVDSLVYPQRRHPAGDHAPDRHHQRHGAGRADDGGPAASAAQGV